MGAVTEQKKAQRTANSGAYCRNSYNGYEKVSASFKKVRFQLSLKNSSFGELSHMYRVQSCGTGNEE